jgi:hypothetical protein
MRSHLFDDDKVLDCTVNHAVVNAIVEQIHSSISEQGVKVEVDLINDQDAFLFNSTKILFSSFNFFFIFSLNSPKVAQMIRAAQSI